MEYYFEMYKKILFSIDSINNDIICLKNTLSEYMKELDLNDKRIFDSRDDTVYEIERLEMNVNNYDRIFKLLLKCKGFIRTNVFIMLFSLVFISFYFFLGGVISNIFLVIFFATSIPSGLCIITSYIKSIFIKRSLSKFDDVSDKEELNLLKEKLHNIDVELNDTYNKKSDINSKIGSAKLQLREKNFNLKKLEMEKTKIEKELLVNLREVFNFSYNKELDGQIIMDDIIKKKTRKL